MTTEQKLDLVLTELAELRRKVEPFAEMVMKAEVVTKAKGLGKNTVIANEQVEKYVEPGKKKVLVSLESVSVLKHRKRAKKQAK